MKVVVLTAGGSRFIVNRLPPEHDYHVVFTKSDHGKLMLRKLRRFVRKKGLLRGAIEYVRFLLEVPYILEEGRKLSEYISSRLGHEPFNSSVKLYHHNSVNSVKTWRRVQQIRPKAIIVIGNELLSTDTIAALKMTGAYLVNWHSGITTHYRGVKSELYCVLNGEPELAGSTVHFIDEGVDTGKIILQRTIDFSPEEEANKTDYRFLRYKNILLAIALLEEFVKMVAVGNVVTQTNSQGRGRLYSTPRKRHYEEYYALQEATKA